MREFWLAAEEHLSWILKDKHFTRYHKVGNLYMNPRLDKLDTMPEHHDNQNYREDITSFLEINNLVDVWRTLHPDEKFFTWHRGNKWTRFDYIFCSDHLLNFIEESSILPGIQSDHSLLKLSLISGNKQNRGKGFWKIQLQPTTWQRLRGKY